MFGRCNGSKEFEIDWGQYLANDSQMLALGETECVVSASPLLPLLAQAIVVQASRMNDVECSLYVYDIQLVDLKKIKKIHLAWIHIKCFLYACQMFLSAC